MCRLIPDYNMSLDVDAIVSAHSQLVSKALGISWAMPLKQWLSWYVGLNLSNVMLTCIYTLFARYYLYLLFFNIFVCVILSESWLSDGDLNPGLPLYKHRELWIIVMFRLELDSLCAPSQMAL